MSEEKVLTPKELKAQADAILAAADGKKAAKGPHCPQERQSSKIHCCSAGAPQPHDG